ncbi:MAG: acyl carrier protein phosphodiesterase [Saprospiraceae bacterium]|jgi:acyl carrier protein phosphodiesterase
MNFLAHMFLTYGDKKLTVGNYVADFIRNRDLVLFPKKVVKGIMLHRHIDHYTDTHEEVLRSTRKLRKRHKKYAPVVIDVFYDYILSKNWETYTNVPIREFADEIYVTLNEYSHLFPIHLQDITERMIADDFLLQYGKKSGMRKTFERIGIRAKFKSNFATAFDDLEKDFDEIQDGFNAFFPDLIAEVEKKKKS